MVQGITTAAIALCLSAGSASAFFSPAASGAGFARSSATTTSSTRIHAFPPELEALTANVATFATEAGKSLNLPQAADTAQQIAKTLSDHPDPQQLYTSLVDALQHLNIDQSLISEAATQLSEPWHLGAIAAFAAGSGLTSFINAPTDFSKAPFEPGTNTYSPEASEDFYSQRPEMVAQRVLRLGLLSGAFNTGLLFDWLVLGKALKDEEYTALRNAEPQRAKEALKLCEQLGPTFIKLGQALSIRTDLVPEAYALELRQLQDAVPPFDTQEAYEILRQELGVSDLSTIFSTLSDKPVASASIGQVYRGTLASNGKDVAIKVQRPGILSEIALDLHVLRLLTPVQTILQNLVNGVKTTQEDIDQAVGLVDEWGRGFVAETDYRLEAENTRTFEAAMRERGLDAVCAPTVVDELVRDKVLVTEWVEGTRLDRDASPDVPRLCGVAINAYLTMLLDTGVLHCDPHPGNLLRTTDGRLCILDWGMTLEVPNDLQYALLEFIAHINVEDYDAIPQDFINLGFAPEGVTEDKLKDSGITEGLSFVFRQLSAGGGPSKIQERVKAEFQDRYGSDLSDEELQKAARSEMMERMEAQLASEGVDVKGVTNVMEEMSRRNRELFALPPWVLYVARAFSTLEGIGLSLDDDYSIVQECYPYLSRRLFTDRSPRAKKALRAMLGLSEEADPTSVQQTANSSDGLSPAKLIEMSEGFASYTAATADVDQDGKGQAAAAAEFTKLFLDPEGSTLQDIAVEETAKLGDAVTRAALRQALLENPAARALKEGRGRLEESGALSSLPGPLKQAFVDRPAELLDLVESLVSSTPEDEKILSTAQELRDVVGPRIFGSNNENSETSGVRNAFAGQLSDGALGVPSDIPNPVNMPVASNSLLSNEETRKTITDQLPGVSALGRRIGAGLLRRAAYRADQSSVLPEETRQALIRANTALADAIEPKMPEDSK